MSCLDCVHTPLNGLIPYLVMEDDCDSSDSPDHHCCHHHCGSPINIHNHNVANAACGGSEAGDGNGGEDPPFNGATVALQASSSTSQTIDTANTGVLVEIDTTDLAVGGITLVNSEAIVPEDGVYCIIAAPQVGNGKAAPNDTFRLWLAKNGTGIPNSNVLMQMGPKVKDVIVSQGVSELVAGDKITCMMSASAGDKQIGLEAIDNEGEPLVPGIIFTMYKVK